MYIWNIESLIIKEYAYFGNSGKGRCQKCALIKGARIQIQNFHNNLIYQQNLKKCQFWPYVKDIDVFYCRDG